MDREQWLIIVVILLSLVLFEYFRTETNEDSRNSELNQQEIPQETLENSSTPTTDQIKLDLVFACDTTGSMGSYIQQAKDNIQTIISEVVALAKTDVHFALVEYRDFPPQDETFITRVSPFTQSLEEMSSYVNKMSAGGGGDGPEAVTEALWEALQLPWRKDSAKVLVLISDAPPHGLESYDEFPNGDPSGRDPLVIAGLMANKGIVIYSVGVEPTLGSYAHGRDFMMALAKMTHGTFLPLSNAKLLPTVVIGGAVEEISLARYMELVKEQSENLKASGVADEEIKHKVFEYLEKQEQETFRLEVDDIYGGNYDYTNRDIFLTSGSLSVLKESGTLNPGLNSGIRVDSPRGTTRDLFSTYDSGFFEESSTEETLFTETQTASIKSNPITPEQADKLYSRYLSQAVH